MQSGGQGSAIVLLFSKYPLIGIHLLHTSYLKSVLRLQVKQAPEKLQVRQSKGHGRHNVWFWFNVYLFWQIKQLEAEHSKQFLPHWLALVWLLSK